MRLWRLGFFTSRPLDLHTHTAREMRNRAGDRVKAAYDALRRHDTDTAVRALRNAVGLLGRLAAGDMMKIKVGGAAAGAEEQGDPTLQQLAFILEASKPARPGTTDVNPFGPEYQRDLAAERIRELKEEAEALKEEQDAVTGEIGDLKREAEQRGREEADAERAAAETGAEEEGQGRQDGQEAAGAADADDEAQAGQEGTEDGEPGQEQAGQGGAGGEEQADQEGAEDGQPGQAQAGEEGGEDATPGGQTAGGEHGGQGEEAAPGQAAMQTADRQAQIAENAVGLADRIRQVADGNETANEIADKFLAAAADAQTAAAGVRHEDFARAHLSAERAGRSLEEALAGMTGMSKEEVNLLVDQVLADLDSILEEQRDIRAKTQEMAESAPGVGQAHDDAPDATTVRDVKGLAPRQDEIRKAMEGVELDLAALRRWAETEAGHETRQSIVAASDAARRARVPQKMANAVVAYSEFGLRAASRDQKAAEKGVRGILGKVQDAYASMASDPLSELQAAEIEAGKIEGSLARLTGETRADQGPDQGAAGGEPGEDLSAAERRRLGEEAARRIGRLARRVRSRDFAVPEADMKRLTEVAGSRSGELGLMAQREDPEVADLHGAAKRVHDKLEADFELAVSAKALFQAQREECPPQYRPLVNRYFEALSEVSH